MKTKTIIYQESLDIYKRYPDSSSFFHDLYINVIKSGSAAVSRQEIDQAVYDLIQGIYRALEKIIKMKADFSVGHYQMVADYSLAIAQAMGLDNKSQNIAYFSGLLHDIGKNHIPDEILYKPGLLDDREWRVMSLHSEISWELLKKLTIFQEEAEIARSHHVKGFKDRGNTGLLTKILIIADAFDAMTNKRVYRKNGKESMSVMQADQEIHRCLDKHFDRQVYFDGFKKWLDAGLSEPDRAVISISNRHPELFKEMRTTREQLDLYNKTELEFIELLKMLVEKSDINKRGYNPYIPATYAYHVAREYGLSKVLANNTFRAALLGGLGQMFLRDQSTVNEKSRLTSVIELRRFALNKAVEVFDLVPGFEELSKIIRFIYESWDGQSSVFNKRSTEIPVESRAVRTGVAYYYYKGDLNRIHQMSGKELDPDMVFALERHLERKRGN